jgi:hypothetical protein
MKRGRDRVGADHGEVDLAEKGRWVGHREGVGLAGAAVGQLGVKLERGPAREILMPRQDAADLPPAGPDHLGGVEAARVVALVGVDRRRLAIVECGHEAAAGPARTTDARILLLDITAFGGGPDTRTRLDAVIVAAQDQVGDAADRVRAVERRGAVVMTSMRSSAASGMVEISTP